MTFSHKDFIDQAAHIATVWVILWLAGASGWLGCAFAGLAIGALAEVKEDGPRTTPIKALNSVLNSPEDMLFYGLAGLAYGLLF